MSRDLQALKEITEKQLRDPTEIRSPDPELWRCSLEGTLRGMTPEEEAKGSGLGRAGCSYILKGGCRRKWVRRTVPYGRFWLL